MAAIRPVVIARADVTAAYARTMRLRTGLAISCAFVMLSAACGGSDTEPTDQTITPTTRTATTQPGAPATAPETLDELPESLMVTIGQTVTVGGFVFDLVDATFSTDGFLGPQLEVTANITNPGQRDKEPNVRTFVTSGGNTFKGVPETEILLAGTSAAGAFVFDVGDSFSFDDAVLLVGADDEAQAVVLLDESGEVVSRNPVDLDTSHEIVAGNLGVTVTGVTVRWDNIYAYTQVKSGSAIVVVGLDVALAGDRRRNFQGRHLSLVLPDGSSVAPVPGTDTQPNEIMESGQTLEGSSVWCEVPDPFAGDYSLVVEGPFADDSSTVTGEASFPLE
jgi:hypothetical protein